MILSKRNQKGNGASDGPRTHDLLHGKQMLYQLSYTRVREEWSILEHRGFCKWFLAFKIVDHHAFAAGFKYFLHELHVHWMLLVGILCGFILEHKIQRHLIRLIDNIPVALGHFTTVIVQDTRAGLEILFGPGEQFFSGSGDIGLGPENDYVRKHDRQRYAAPSLISTEFISNQKEQHGLAGGASKAHYALPA
ncbi:uncharacterized protein METZ01_LOCUS141479 [marine metagenome]|uniref:Uncharacterized protein n=1 Tax=marine metagenome TaxID=408172 RepID=A0A381ZH74_9ZZZZ